MRKTLVVACLLSMFLLSDRTFASDYPTFGIVVHKMSDCEHFMVRTTSDYEVMEWMGGPPVMKGESLHGPFDRLGMHEFHREDDEDDDPLRAFVEYVGLSKEDALEELVEKCE